MPQDPARPDPPGPRTPPGADLLLGALAAADAPLAIADSTAPGTPVVWANAAFAAAVGRHPDDVVGHPSVGLDVRPEPLRHAPGTPAGGLCLLRADRGDGEHARRSLALVERVGTLLSASLDVDEALRHVVATAVPELADWCAVDLLVGDGPLPPDADRPPDVPDVPDVPDAPDAPDAPDVLDVVNEVEQRRVRTAVAHRDPAKQALLWRMAELDARRPGTSVVPRTLVSARTVLLERLTPEITAARTAGDPELAEIFAALDNRAGAVVPLVARGRVLGALTLSVTGESGRPFGPRELAVAEMLATRAALAVDNARLFAAETAGRRRAAALAEAGIALTGTLRTREVLDVLLGIVVPDVADWSFVLLDPALTAPDPRLAARAAPPDTLRLAASRHRDPQRQAATHDYLSGLALHRGAAGPGTAWSTGRTQLVRAVDAAYLDALFPGRPDLARAARELAVTTSVHVPLLAGSRVVGTWSVLRHRGDPFTDADARFLTELGRRAAQGLANARAFEAEQVVALELQRSLLPPSLPQVPGLQVAGRYLAGRGGAVVGGDWYDVVVLPDGRVGLSVGDVMGRGVRAAAVMGQLRAAVRSYAAEGLPPREVLARLAAFTATLDGDHFATCLYAVHDPATHVTTVASAGHPPPLLVPAGDGEARPLEVLPGVPLGVDDGRPAYADATVRLGPGDCLLLYTDGLVEDRAMSFGDGLGRLAAGLARARPATADAACAAALRVMGRDRLNDDDTAMLAVRTSAASPDVGPAGPRTTHVRLSAQPRAAAAARRHVVGALVRWGAPDAAETAALLVSELVANAVRHGHGPIDVELSDGPDGWVVRIGDASPVLPPVPGRLPAAQDAAAGLLDLSESGRGLVLVEALAAEWGWTARPDTGKDVWFRLARSPG